MAKESVIFEEKTMNYGDKLRHPLWQAKRLFIFNRDKFTCQMCEDKETELQVHHLKYYGNPWEANDDDLVTYCKHCHSLVESIKQEPNFRLIRVYKHKTKHNDFYVLCGLVQAISTNLYSVFITKYDLQRDLYSEVITIPPDCLRNCVSMLDDMKERSK